MDLLRNLFGNVTSGIIRLAVTVGIIAAVGYFIVKPVLSTTDRAFDTVDKALEESGIDDISEAVGGSNLRVQRRLERQLKHSFRVSVRNGDTDKLVACIQRAQGNVKRIQRCSQRYR
jgi:hypothetical protein